MRVNARYINSTSGTSSKGAGIAQWLEHRTRDWKVAGSNPCWNGGRIFFSRVDFLCWLLFRYPFHPRVTAVARKKSRSFCQKCRWQVTAKHAYTRIEPCFGIGHNLSLICQMTSEDIKHQLNNNILKKGCALSGIYDPPIQAHSANSSVGRASDWKSQGAILTRVRVPGAARDFSPRASFQCRLSYGVRAAAPVCNRMHQHLYAS